MLKPVAFTEADGQWMSQALVMARKAFDCEEVPVGAVLVRDNEIIGQGWNAPIGRCDPTAHAEIVALRHGASAVGNYRLPNTTLYVTIEPCTMCLGAMMHARIERVVFGAPEPRAGVLLSQAYLADKTAFFNHELRWSGGVQRDQCGELIQQFFQQRRQKKCP